VTVPELLLLVAAGAGAGLAGSVAGLASLVSYPALLATGLAPVTANVTNTVALVFSTAGSTLGSRVELEGQGGQVRALALTAVAGGAVGAAVLLVLPASSFERVAPWLIAAASTAILARPGAPGPRAGPPLPSAALLPGVFLVGVYGGYFGAAAGVVLLALLLAGTSDTLARTNALKNAVLGIANGTAALAFCVLAPVRWAAVVPLAVGLFAGGRLGPVVVRRSNAGALRTVIGVAGLALAVKLAVDAY
jgi:uncharacterized membrane protein YfcA